MVVVENGVGRANGGTVRRILLVFLLCHGCVQRSSAATSALTCLNSDDSSTTVSINCNTGQATSSLQIVAIRRAFLGLSSNIDYPYCPLFPNPTTDCIPDIAADTVRYVSVCNMLGSCAQYETSSGLTNRPICQWVNGLAYAYVEYDCLPRFTLSGNQALAFLDIDQSSAYSDLSERIYVRNGLNYPGFSQLVASSYKCQITMPADTTVQIDIIDLRTEGDAASGCLCSLGIYDAGTNTSRQWCATSSWSQASPVTLFSALFSELATRTIDVVLTTNTSASAALWLSIFAIYRTNGSLASGFSTTCSGPPTTTTTSTTSTSMPLPTSTSTTTMPTTTPTTTSTTTRTTTTTSPTTTPTTTSTTTRTTTTTSPTTTPTTTSTTTRTTTTTSPTTTPTTTSTTTRTTTTTSPTTTPTTTATTTRTSTTTTNPSTTPTRISTTTSTASSTTRTSTTSPTTPGVPSSSDMVSMTTQTTTTTSIATGIKTSQPSSPSSMPLTDQLKPTTTFSVVSEETTTTTNTSAVGAAVGVLPLNVIVIIACSAGGGLLLLLIIIIISSVVCRKSRRKKAAVMLPMVTSGTWAWEGSEIPVHNAASPPPVAAVRLEGDGSSEQDVIIKLPPPSSPIDRIDGDGFQTIESSEHVYSVIEDVESSDAAYVTDATNMSWTPPSPVFLQQLEDPREISPTALTSPITPFSMELTPMNPITEMSPVISANTSTPKSILSNGKTKKKKKKKGRSNKGQLQVRFTVPDDDTIHYPGRGANILDDDHLWRHRAMMNEGDRYPRRTQANPAPIYSGTSVDNSLSLSRGYPTQSYRGPPPPYSSNTDYLSSTGGNSTLPRVSAVQATEDDTQQNPLYGAAIDFIY